MCDDNEDRPHKPTKCTALPRFISSSPPNKPILPLINDVHECYDSTAKFSLDRISSNSTATLSSVFYIPSSSSSSSDNEEEGDCVDHIRTKRYLDVKLSESEDKKNDPHWTRLNVYQFLRPKVFLSFILWFIAYTIMGVLGGSLAFYHFPRVESNFQAPLTLPDFGYSLVPYWCPVINDNVDANPQSVILFTFYTIILIGATFHSHGRLILQQLFHLNILVFLTRTTTVFVTGLPQPNPRCTTVQSWDTTFLQSIQFVWKRFPPRACGDLIYSGHVACILVCMVILHKHAYFRRKYYLAVLGWIKASCGIYAVISCRSHYTVDVILAGYFVFFIQEWYFGRSEGRFRGGKLGQIIRWLEDDEGRKI